MPGHTKGAGAGNRELGFLPFVRSNAVYVYRLRNPTLLMGECWAGGPLEASLLSHLLRVISLAAANQIFVTVRRGSEPRTVDVRCAKGISPHPR